MDISTLRQLFGQRLRSLRRQNELTQEDLAEEAAVSVEFVSKIERGLKGASFDTIVRLSNALEVPPKHLFDFSGNDSPGDGPKGADLS